MIYSLIYFSKATKPMQDEDLLPLLEESRSWNLAHGITGMLLYIAGETGSLEQGGRFMQALEGTEVEVRGIFEKIRSDKRHHHLMVLNEATAKKRNFAAWTMGFASMDIEEYKAKLGFFELNDTFLNKGNKQKLNMALNFLKSFYTMNLSSKVK
jgi:hypothetical protein